MPSLPVVVWLCRRTLASPLPWLGLGLLVLLSAMEAQLGQVGIATGRAGSSQHIYDLAFTGAVPGLAVALWVLARQSWLLPALEPSQALASHSVFLLLAATTGIVASIGTLGGPTEPLAAAPRLACVVLHLSALALLVSRFAQHPGLPPLLLVSALWWIPASFPGDSWLWGSLIDSLLGPLQSQTQMATPVDMAPAVAFGLAAWLLTPRISRA